MSLNCGRKPEFPWRTLRAEHANFSPLYRINHSHISFLVIITFLINYNNLLSNSSLTSNCDLTLFLWLLKKCVALCQIQGKLNTVQRASKCIQLDLNESSVGHWGLLKYNNLANESFSSSICGTNDMPVNNHHLLAVFFLPRSDLFILYLLLLGYSPILFKLHCCKSPRHCSMHYCIGSGIYSWNPGEVERLHW